MKHLHPKIRQKKKKWSLEQLKELIPVTVLKLLNRICKQLKVLLVLKTTKKITNYREQQLMEKYEQEVQQLTKLKAVNHSELAKFLALKNFSEEVDCTTDFIDSDSLAELFQNHPKFRDCLNEIRKKIEPLILEREKLLQKEQNILQQQLKQKPNRDNVKTSVKHAAVKAVFLSSLGGDSEDEQEGEDDEAIERREQMKIEKSLRNRINRQKNREQREKEAKELEMYMPESDRILTKSDEKGSIKPKPKSQKPFIQNELRKPKRNREDFDDKPNSGNPEVNKNKRPKNNEKLPEDEGQLKTMVASGKEWKETGVHPSWAAKQLQKTTQISITAAPQGKKIVFEED